MGNHSDITKKIQEQEGREQIKKLQEKIDITKYNMEISKEIIAETPSDTQQEKLTQKNIRRRHGIAGLKKEIQEIRQALDK